MKKFLIMSLLVLSCISVSAKKQEPGVPLECDTVIQVPDLTAEQIYNNVKVWFADNMRSANNVIQLDDASNKHIIGKANIKFTVNHFTWGYLSGIIRFTIDIAARDGRLRLRMSDFNHEAYKDGWTEGLVYVKGPNPNVNGLRKKQNSEMQKRAGEKCIQYIAYVIASLQETMSGGLKPITEDDW